MLKQLLKRLFSGPGASAGKQAAWETGDSSSLFESSIARRLDYIQEIKQPLLLISEIQRSGGTLMSQLLDGHPEIYAHPHELKIGRPSKFYWPRLDLSAGPDEWWEGLRENQVVKHAALGYRKGQSADKQKEKPLPFIFSQGLQERIFKKMASSCPRPTQRQILDAYATSYFNGWIDYQGLYRDSTSVRFWSAFVPRLATSEEQCAAFFSDYPDGYLLSVIRNPASWFVSARRHKPEEYILEKAAELWVESTSAAMRNSSRYPGRVLLVHFDSLVKDTEATMRAVCGRLGMAFSESLVVPTFNSLPMSANSSFNASPAGSILKASVGRGQQLTAAESSYLLERTEACYREVLTQVVCT